MHIVLITRENSERVTHVSVNLWSNYSEAARFCYFVNNLPLDGENKLSARNIKPGNVHALEKHQPFNFDDFVKVDDRMIQLLMRELDAETLVIALKDAKEEVKNAFFRNMSKRASCMIKEDMEVLWPVDESEIENARKLILIVFNGLPAKGTMPSEMEAIVKNINNNKQKKQTDFDGMNYIVLTFQGAGTAADRVSVFLFDDYDKADNFCNYLNNLKPENGYFIYAKHADQMIEYETTKPLLISFDQIFELFRYHGVRGDMIIREALKKIASDTILTALKGMDKRSRMLIMQSLPTKTTDEINEKIEQSDDLCSLKDTRMAQERIINAINKKVDKLKREKRFNAETIMD